MSEPADQSADSGAPDGNAAAADAALLSRPPPSSDPWAHRRAEPRTFAFIWTVYLFVATISTYALTVTSGIGGHDVIRPAARILMALVAAGIVVVWPLVRLSQLPDPRPIAGPILDWVVIFVPIQAVIWPQTAWWLANWPFEVIAAVSIFIAAAAAIMGAVISTTHSLRGRTSPAAWMGTILVALLLLHIPALLSAGPAPAAPDASTNEVRTAWMCSPITAVYELTRERTWIGTPAKVFPGHWRLIAAWWGFAMALWLLAITLRFRARRTPPRGLH